MLTMDGVGLIFILALCFMCVSSKDEHYFDNSYEDSEFCETQTLSAALGSSVLLQCNFSTSNLGWVLWAHLSETDLVHLTSEGRVKFVDPRHGRVKAFPNQGSEGNYSICINDLETSDLGLYRCKRGTDCLQVELVTEIGSLSEEMLLLIYICVGVAVILLTVVGYFCVKCILYCKNRTQDNVNNLVDAGTEVASAPPEETGTAPANEQQRGADNLIYENDDRCPASQQGDPTRNHCHLPGVQPNVDQTQPTQSTSGIYPSLSQFNCERVESQRGKQRFHTELFSRLRQASLSRHYYVNQGELSKQQATSAQAENRRKGLGKKKVKENCEYKNPIYNRSTDQLNRL